MILERDQGWIKLHRKIIKDPIMKDAYLFQLWSYILLNVNHQTNSFIFNEHEVCVTQGQGIFGIDSITKDLSGLRETSKKYKKYRTMYYRKLQILQKIGKLKLQPTNRFTIITVFNWEKYQRGLLNEIQTEHGSKSLETQPLLNNNDYNKKNVKKFLGFYENCPVYTFGNINKIKRNDGLWYEFGGDFKDLTNKIVN